LNSLNLGFCAEEAACASVSKKGTGSYTQDEHLEFGRVHFNSSADKSMVHKVTLVENRDHKQEEISLSWVLEVTASQSSGNSEAHDTRSGTISVSTKDVFNKVNQLIPQ